MPWPSSSTVGSGQRPGELDDIDHLQNKRVRPWANCSRRNCALASSAWSGGARAHDQPDSRGDQPASVISIKPLARRSTPSSAAAALPVHGPDQPASRAGPRAAPVGPGPGVCPSRAPSSRSVTSTPATTAVSAPLRPPKVPTSASSATWRCTPASTSSASSRRPTAR